MTQVVDYSTARPDPGSLKRQGFVGALRYLATLPNPKVIDKAELQRLLDAGLSVGFVWEVGTDWTTWNGGEADRQLDGMGVPDDVPIYWAVDRDWSDYALVGRMLDGVNSRRPRGVYGGSGLVQYQLDHGHARYGWIAAASSWGHGQPAPGAHLHQRVGGAPPGCDVNDVLNTDWGQWPRPDAGDDMPNNLEIIADVEQALRVMVGLPTDPPATPEQFQERLGQIVAAHLPVGTVGASVDLDALADKVADKLAARLQS